MIEELELLITIAEITGVFIGFGALISISRPKNLPESQLINIRGIVTVGLLVFIAALLPIIFTLYHFTDHFLWFISSLLFFILNTGGMIYELRKPKNRAYARTSLQTNPAQLLFFLLEVIVQVSLILILIGIFPTLEPAFYITALVSNLFQGVFMLGQTVSADLEPSDTDHAPHHIHH